MGQYKVPQNVESEDKIIGPLTFRQFLYAFVGFGWALLCFGLLRAIPALMVLVAGPPTLILLLLAFYTRDGQNFEQLLIAMVGFFASDRKRLWVKEEIEESFHIERKKTIAEVTQRNPTEVRGELEKLATLIDSRGWNRPPEPGPVASFVLPSLQHEERIVAPPLTPHAPDEPKSDMLDLQHSPLAQNLSELLRQAAEDVREEAMDQMSARPARQTAAGIAPTSISGVTAAAPNDILKLATQNDDLTVSQIAAQATRIAPLAQAPMPQTAPGQPQGQVVELRTNGS
ncbi:MAG: hypothetical protein JWN01_1062 [Patescibacteria group bacterium]|nr:hypothetical protein [Patescibacteria group bacterium]